MADRITDVDSFFSTTLTSSVTAASTTFPVASTGSLTSPCIITINGDNPGPGADTREVIYCDGGFTGTSFATSDRTANSLLSTGPTTHSSGAVVEVRLVAEHIDDLNDRVSGHTHTGGDDGTAVAHADLTGLTSDDHTNYSLVDGTRAFTGDVESVATTTSSTDLTLATKGYVDDRMPSGSITMYGATSAPTGWLSCNGNAVSRTTYADLFAVIGTTFGVGDGSTTFNLPDLRTKFPVGAKAGGDYDLADTGGSESVTLTTAQMPSHTHTGPSHSHTVDPPNTSTSTDGSHTHGAGTYSVYNVHKLTTDGEATGSAERHRTTGADADFSVSGNSASGGSHSHTVNIAQFNSGNSGTGATGSAGSGSSHENRPPFIALNFIIKT